METDRDSILRNVSSLARPIVDEAGFEWVEMELAGRQGNYILRLLIDKPGGVTIDDCVAINRELSNLLDLEDPIPSRYTLEVSSPGLDRPFKTERDYRKALGKRVKVVTVDDDGGPVTRTGRLEGIEDGTVEIVCGDVKHRISVASISKAHRELDHGWENG
ncbi:MAG: ribosome maturation factor RimP [Gemmatimonadetes bacterium]|nr:ribosome maturation factor RimP [Gemmatimonadota bacterium]